MCFSEDKVKLLVVSTVFQVVNAAASCITQQVGGSGEGTEATALLVNQALWVQKSYTGSLICKLGFLPAEYHLKTEALLIAWVGLYLET